MASIWKEITIAAAATEVWDAVRDYGAAHRRLFPGLLVDCRVAGGARVVTFADGREVREPIVAVDDERRRLTWTATGGALVHHHGSMQVLDGDGGCRLLWITDVLPDEAGPRIAAIVEAGAAVLKRTLEATACSLAPASLEC